MATVAPTIRLTSTTLASASAGPFSVGFRLFEADGLTVSVNSTEREDWTLSANLDGGFTDAATITFDASLEVGDVLAIEGTMDPKRDEDYLPTEPRLNDKLNAELARIWAVLIEQAFRANGALRATTSQAAVSLTDNTVPIFKDGAWAQGPSVENINDAETLLAALTGITPSATTLAPGASATASFDGETGVLALGIPEGEKGDTGASGSGSGDLVSTSNLSDVADIPTARTNLGLGTAATVDVIDEDSFATNSATRPPSQQSTKAYVDTEIAATSIEPELLEMNELQAVGAFIFARGPSTTTYGSVVAGSSLIYAGALSSASADAGTSGQNEELDLHSFAFNTGASGVPAGSWRCLGHIGATATSSPGTASVTAATLWQRVI